MIDIGGRAASGRRAHVCIRAQRGGEMEGGSGTGSGARHMARTCRKVFISSKILEMKRNIYTRQEAALAVVSGLQFDVPVQQSLRILDLGCGDGVFLEATGHVLRTRYPARFHHVQSLATALTGVEVDPCAARGAEIRLSRRFGRPAEGWDIRISDALWLDEAQKYHVIVGNPPWVRLHHLDTATRAQARSDFKSARGSFDLAYLFVEKAVRLLAPGGQLAFIVPRGIGCQPAAAPLRHLLTLSGSWEIKPLTGECFAPPADVDAATLTFRKHPETRTVRSSPRKPSLVLGDLATITTGVATGGDSVFLVDLETVREWKMERAALRPAIRGRDIVPGQVPMSDATMHVIWPYREERGRWVLGDLSGCPNVAAYLEEHRKVLTGRPRLSAAIERQPRTWYRLIDPGRIHRLGTRMIVADIFRAPAFVVADDPSVVAMNTCFEIAPKLGCTATVLEALQSAGFWETLRADCRRLRNGYRRTSVRELRSTALDKTPATV